MPIEERITNSDELRAWKDKIPLRYEYTAGVAGEHFLRGLKRGEITIGQCGKCGKRYLPPKMYCVDCFAKIDRFNPVGNRGSVAALTESWVDFQGKRLKVPVTFAFVVFKGVEGGIVHAVKSAGLKLGTRVEPRFVAESERKGSLLDIEDFVPV